MVTKKELDQTKKKWYDDGRWADVLERFVIRTRFHIKKITGPMSPDIGEDINYLLEQFLYKKEDSQLIQLLEMVPKKKEFLLP